MTVGLQINDENGNIKVDMTTNLPRIIGQATLNGSGAITSSSVGYPNNNLWYIVTTNASPASKAQETPVLRIVDNGKTIKWQNQVGTIIKYGVI